MMRVSLFLSMMAILVAGSAQAETACTPTASVQTRNYPGVNNIPPSNNLLKPNGKAVVATGQRVTIHGQVLDTNCMPVPNAVVELWQNGPTGRWLLAQGEDLASARAVFAGAGRTYTDTDGNFTFITAFPAPLNGHAPFVNLRVTGDGIPDLKTALFFSDDARNTSDKDYLRLKDKPRQDTLIRMQQNGDELVGTVKLVIASRAPYRTY